MFTSDAFKNPTAFSLPGGSEDILKKTEELLERFQAKREMAESLESIESIESTGGAWRVGLNLGKMQSLKVNSVKQSKSGTVYALDVAKDNEDYGYGLNYTKYPRVIKDNLMATAYKKIHTTYLTPVIGVGLGTAKQNDDRHLAWNVNIGTETSLTSTLTFVSKMNYTDFGKNSRGLTSTYGLHYTF
jgi:opacity protein-like surface antigen